MTYMPNLLRVTQLQQLAIYCMIYMLHLLRVTQFQQPTIDLYDLLAEFITSNTISAIGYLIV